MHNVCWDHSRVQVDRRLCYVIVQLPALLSITSHYFDSFIVAAFGIM